MDVVVVVVVVVVVDTFEAAAGLIHHEEDGAEVDWNHHAPEEDEEEVGLIHPAEVGDVGEVGSSFHQNSMSTQPCQPPEGHCQLLDRIQRVRNDGVYKGVIG